MKKPNTLLLRLYQTWRIRFFGSPAWAGCWLDEGQNIVLKSICGRAHPSHWHARVLSTYKHLQARKRRA